MARGKHKDIVEFRCPFCFGRIVATIDIDDAGAGTIERAMAQHKPGCPILKTYKAALSMPG